MVKHFDKHHSLGRSLRLGGAGLRMTGHVLGDGLRSRLTGQPRDWQPVGEQLHAVLSELRGPVLKLGQMLSQWREVLPGPIVDALAGLRDDVPPVSFATVRTTLLHELGRNGLDGFAWLDAEPFAAASLGQVHRGRLTDGSEVVVKVQYPDMPAICEADLRQLRRLLPLARLLGVPSERLEAIHRELGRTIRRELDYRRERGTLERFRRRYARWPDIQLPEPLPAYCTDRVLTLTYEPASTLETATGFPAAIRNDLARTLLRFAATQMLVDGELHADPHPGNFGFRDDGTLVVYDFGCATEVSARVRSGYVQGYRAIQESKPDALDAALHTLGSRRPATPPPRDLYRELVALLNPVVRPRARWDFGDGRLHREAMAMLPRVLNRLNDLQPAADAVLVNRTLDGHYWTLVALAAELSVDAIIAPMLDNGQQSN